WTRSTGSRASPPPSASMPRSSATSTICRGWGWRKWTWTWRTTGRWTWRWRCRWRRQDGRRSPAPTATRTTTSAPSASTSRRTTPTSHTPRSPCPICSEKITRDMLNHITMHHGYLFKALLGGGHSHRSRNTTAATTNIYADPLLSSFGLGFATSDAEEPSKSSVPVLDDTSILKEAPPQPWESRYI
uniref:Uncharacterized protein n=1 Tax=Aegilops tauschii subsp. strangulata TaxID=200361 RepID=A0A453F7M8_AEGTS